MELLGKRIRHCRQLLGMTQEELAGNVCTKAFISQVENGDAVPSLETLVVLAKRLYQCPGYFLAEDCRLDRSSLAVSVAAKELSAAAERIKDQIVKINEEPPE